MTDRRPNKETGGQGEVDKFPPREASSLINFIPAPAVPYWAIRYPTHCKIWAKAMCLRAEIQ